MSEDRHRTRLESRDDASRRRKASTSGKQEAYDYKRPESVHRSRNGARKGRQLIGKRRRSDSFSSPNSSGHRQSLYVAKRTRTAKPARHWSLGDNEVYSDRREQHRALGKVAYRTFVVESLYFRDIPLVDLLNANGWKRLSVDEACRAGYVDVIVLDGHLSQDKRLYKFRSAVKCRIDAKLLSNKISLHEALLDDRETAAFVAETVVLDDSSTSFTIRQGDIWIWRPEGGRHGTGVRVCSTQEDIDSIRSEHANRVRERRRGRYLWGRRGILSRYITKPLLIRKRKFHIRMYFMVLLEGSKGGRIPHRVRTLMLRQGYMFTAGKEYHKGDWDDAEVHDTHISSTDGEIRFPRDFPKQGDINGEHIFQRMIKCLRATSRVLAPTFRLYKESDTAFEVFGVDFMVTEEGKLVLIEVNFKPGLAAMKDRPNLMYNNIFNSILVSTKGLDLKADKSLEDLCPVWLFDSAMPRAAPPAVHSAS